MVNNPPLSMPPADSMKGQHLTAPVAAPAGGNGSRHALERLRALIRNGELQPGEQIRQEETALRIGVSRGPLREAMNVLADRGILVHRPNQGYFVRKRAASDLDQVRRMQFALEDALLVGLPWPESSHVAGLRALTLEMRRQWGLRGNTGCDDLCRSFDAALFKLTPDLLILGEVQRFWSWAESASRGTPANSEHVTLQTMESIVEALEARDRSALLHCYQLRRHGGSKSY